MTATPPFSTRSSGDMIADRRYAYGDAALAEQDWQAAFDLFEQTLELVPHWPPAHLALARAALALGEEETARAALERVLTLDPADHLGAAMLLAQIGSKPVAEAMPAAYVAALFDDYAPRFDSHLVNQLAYRAPELLVAALDRHQPERHFAHVLDLGCGTGLMARALGSRAGLVFGVDLSPRMVAVAAETRLYAGLQAGELVAFLTQQPVAGADLTIAADVFCYVPDLAPAFAEARRCLAPSGILAFTVQTHPGEGVVVGEDCRIHHAPGLVRHLAVEAGFTLLAEEEAVSRLDAGKPVPGALFLLAAP
ncbi:methyltransferase domain-containing protein [Rhabdaerophilum sp. SD176]|uniref:methyltransferase domain-containing protein n=1 Tax=Rhabdaerophilum sp. SD176 TaxID=2983548 RepID=UPI0024DFEBC3|nr:methyltransferase domain-containing protein [Rhabdaerophilum sp. SD176]